MLIHWLDLITSICHITAKWYCFWESRIQNCI